MCDCPGCSNKQNFLCKSVAKNATGCDCGGMNYECENSKPQRPYFANCKPNTYPLSEYRHAYKRRNPNARRPRKAAHPPIPIEFRPEWNKSIRVPPLQYEESTDLVERKLDVLEAMMMADSDPRVTPAYKAEAKKTLTAVQNTTSRPFRVSVLSRISVKGPPEGKPKTDGVIR